ncbi:MAG: hypothetical protein A2233_01465 [Candidatus Kerfeldbacteria bacterium RIFOXYA2_FULL_38_24]|uniref:DUF218 domain-containing protein n=1 Tax=Candidatus Kerfeldbacteria bacterium RIFOXYB2_FULL_38_14 TaxID=1798547 RepID=A0A1G2BDS6_9BACT|nr:MAG: hypothetical protein A2233_01465 [Candidatus Kerfeldbacteria bacterium RIFOXYA2_FULL_38_24]OGY87403.1 MAG: hypothetical protein A2319_05555 [Candidatus Kerfeldbacteria bacterium RIFOXYB2_FULL_38_14]OGY90353.1 MAG: hypothetical protein A2458_04460 [Candidatus Kerfeldbacteria bacterium RIFOXYC2_FULL_38_9]
MQNIFLIFGYGVPKNILKDENYNFYLKTVFNKIYSLTEARYIKDPLIIFCGGKTDCFKPYRRNEADEMIKLFKKISQRAFLKEKTNSWTFTGEKQSLSTLENFLNSKKILKKKKIHKARLCVFCEQTREKRVAVLTKKIFNENYTPLTIPVDFDTSANRYLDHKFLEKKEKETLKYDLWALKNKDNFKKYHRFFQEKIKLFQKADPKKHQEAILEWWKEKLIHNKL